MSKASKHTSEMDEEFAYSTSNQNGGGDEFRGRGKIQDSDQEAADSLAQQKSTWERQTDELQHVLPGAASVEPEIDDGVAVEEGDQVVWEEETYIGPEGKPRTRRKKRVIKQHKRDNDDLGLEKRKRDEREVAERNQIKQKQQLEMQQRRFKIEQDLKVQAETQRAQQFDVVRDLAQRMAALKATMQKQSTLLASQLQQVQQSQMRAAQQQQVQQQMVQIQSVQAKIITQQLQVVQQLAVKQAQMVQQVQLQQAQRVSQQQVVQQQQIVVQQQQAILAVTQAVQASNRAALQVVKVVEQVQQAQISQQQVQQSVALRQQIVDLQVVAKQQVNTIKDVVQQQARQAEVALQQQLQQSVAKETAKTSARQQQSEVARDINAMQQKTAEVARDQVQQLQAQRDIQQQVTREVAQREASKPSTHVCNGGCGCSHSKGPVNEELAAKTSPSQQAERANRQQVVNRDQQAVLAKMTAEQTTNSNAMKVAELNANKAPNHVCVNAGCCGHQAINTAQSIMI